MLVAGIDPGLNRCGFALSDDVRGVYRVGTIKTPQKESLQGKLNMLRLELGKRLSYNMDLVVVEVPGRWVLMRGAMQRPETVLHLGAAIGAILLACTGLRTELVTVDEIRKQMLGKASANKEAVADYLIEKGLSLPRLQSGNVDTDAADAMVASLYGQRLVSAAIFKPTTTG